MRKGEMPMPAVYAHIRFGEEVAKNLPMPHTNLIERFPEAFHLGTQGPDILFYYKPLKDNDIRTYGKLLHAHSGEEFFLTLGEKLLNEADTDNEAELLTKNGAFAAYTCGFLCHFTLDVLCHPHVNEKVSEALSHGKIESEFDKFLLRLDGKPIRGYNTATPILDKNGAKAAAAKALDVEENNIGAAIKTMRNINAWFSRKCELSHKFAHTVLKTIHMDKTFGDMFLHKTDDPLCIETNKTLLQKFKDAIPVAAALIPHYFQNLRAWVQNKRCENNLFRHNFSGILKTEE